MRKLLYIFIAFLIGFTPAFANDVQEARAFFNNYVSAANSYSPTIEKMYSPNAVIIRQVIKPNGQLVNVYGSCAEYLKQMKISQGIAKARNYKNTYSNISVTKVAKGYKISATRQPAHDTDKLKMYQIVAEKNGKWLIVEEMMQTRQQIFLKHMK